MTPPDASARWHCLALNAIPPTPWKNGAGVTRILDAREGLWRISLASIQADGPYSRFPGMDRLSMIIEGDGVLLQDGHQTLPLPPWQPVRYDGERAWHATLRHGPCTAFNLMAAANNCQADMHAATHGTEIPAWTHAVVLAPATPCTLHDLSDHASLTIRPGQFALIRRGPAAIRLSMHADASACLATLTQIPAPAASFSLAQG